MIRILAIFFVLFLAVHPAYAATDVLNDDTLPTSLVSYWELEEASGTRVDIHGPNDLTDVNTVLSATGIQGDAADFELSNSEVLSITDASQVGLDFNGSNLSISAWIKLETDPGATTATIVSKYGNASSRNYLFDIGDTDKFRFFTGDATFNVCTVTWNPSTATWYHVAGVFDASADTIKLYVNGAQQGATCTSMTGVIANGTIPFQIGARTNSDAPYYFDGIIDEVGVWSKALTDAEVVELYNSGTGIPYEADAPPADPASEPGMILFNGTGGVIINGSGRIDIH